MISMNQTLKSRHPEPITSLVERLPEKEGGKLSSNQEQFSWEDLRGLSWTLLKESEYQK